MSAVHISFSGNKTRILVVLMLIFMSFPCVFATNIVTYSVKESGDAESGKLVLRFNSISNEDSLTHISFDIMCADAPFTIYKAQWRNCDTIMSPLEPFSLIASNEEVENKDTEWHITLEFPFSDRFDDSDVLILTTDRGEIRCHTLRSGQLKEQIDILTHEYEQNIDAAKRSTNRAWIILGIVVCLGIIAACVACFIVRHRNRARQRQLDELSLLIAERSETNRELRAKVDALYGSRLEILNMLCNEYFEKNDSEKLRLTLYNEVEKQILALRERRNISELETIVNTYLDNILVSIKEQISWLNRKDIVFLTYLYAGFSPRAVCLFTDIKIKNFYNRRSRLKERILASDAPDKEYFVSKM